MIAYRLRVSLRFVDGRGGTAISNVLILAEDAPNAIEIAQEWHPKAPGIVAMGLTLADLKGTIVWTRRHPPPDSFNPMRE